MTPAAGNDKFWGGGAPPGPGQLGGRRAQVDGARRDQTRSRGRFGRGTSVRNGRAGPTAGR